MGSNVTWLLERSVASRRQFSITSSTRPPSDTSETPSPEEDADKGPAAEVSLAEVVEELRKAITELENELASSEEKCKDLQDRLLRALAENENARVRYRKEVRDSIGLKNLTC